MTNANTQFKLAISTQDIDRLDKCVICIQGKSVRVPIHQHADPQYKATEPIQTLHADLVGPATAVVANKKRNKRHPRCPTIGGHLYALIVTDEFTHAVFVILLKLKSDAGGELIKLIKQIQTQTGRLVERFHSDGGGEFSGTDFQSFLRNNGTKATYTTASTPTHNGLAERMNRTLFELTRTLLIQANAPEELWGEALMWATRLYKVTPHPISTNQPPFQLLFNYRYNVQKLRVWGCDANVHKLPDKRSKIQARAWVGIFVGFHKETSAYRIMNPITKVIANSNDVRFDEYSFKQIQRIEGIVPPVYVRIKPFLSRDTGNDETWERPPSLDEIEVVSDNESETETDSISDDAEPIEDDPTEDSEVEEIDEVDEAHGVDNPADSELGVDDTYIDLTEDPNPSNIPMASEQEPTEDSDIDEVDIDAANIDELAEASVDDERC